MFIIRVGFIMGYLCGIYLKCGLCGCMLINDRPIFEQIKSLVVFSLDPVSIGSLKCQNIYEICNSLLVKKTQDIV